jgi:hypothetical protein
MTVMDPLLPQAADFNNLYMQLEAVLKLSRLPFQDPDTEHRLTLERVFGDKTKVCPPSTHSRIEYYCVITLGINISKSETMHCLSSTDGDNRRI